MCSSPQQRIAAFGRAIEEFAAHARSQGAGASGPSARSSVSADAAGRAGAGHSAGGDAAGNAADPGGIEPAAAAQYAGALSAEGLDTARGQATAGGPATPGGAVTSGGAVMPDGAVTPDGAVMPDAAVTPGGAGQTNAAPADVLSQLAALWAELAILDPEVARRLPTYEASSNSTGSPPIDVAGPSAGASSQDESNSPPPTSDAH